MDLTLRMKTRIISAFPGIGKTHYHKLHPELTLDSDSSMFSWVVDSEGNKVRNPEFPGNYIEHIKQNIGKYEFIFVSSHKEVRDALLYDCIFFYLLYPNKYDKDRFIEIYKKRGNDEKFITLISDNWNNWIKSIECCDLGCKKVECTANSIEMKLRHIVASENGER